MLFVVLFVIIHTKIVLIDCRIDWWSSIRYVKALESGMMPGGHYHFSAMVKLIPSASVPNPRAQRLYMEITYQIVGTLQTCLQRRLPEKLIALNHFLCYL